MKTLITIPTAPSATTPPLTHPRSRRRRAAHASSEPFPGAPSKSVDAILTDYQDQAAETFGDARKLAIALREENHPLRRLALQIALAVARMAGLAHDAAEVASLAEGEVTAW